MSRVSVLLLMLAALLMGVFSVAAQDQPFAGQTIVVATQTGPAISGPVKEFGPEWAAQTGATVEVAEFAFGELYEKILTSFETGSADFDMIIFPADWAGDFMADLGIWTMPLRDSSVQAASPPLCGWRSLSSRCGRPSKHPWSRQTICRLWRFQPGRGSCPCWHRS